MLNIWILEKTGAKEYPGAALQLIKFIQDERCRMDASRAVDTLLVSSGKGATNTVKQQENKTFVLDRRY